MEKFPGMVANQRIVTLIQRQGECASRVAISEAHGDALVQANPEKKYIRLI
jgi:hypothetical protein